MEAAGVELLTQPRTEPYGQVVVSRDVMPNQRSPLVRDPGTTSGTPRRDRLSEEGMIRALARHLERCPGQQAQEQV